MMSSHPNARRNRMCSRASLVLFRSLFVIVCFMRTCLQTNKFHVNQRSNIYVNRYYKYIMYKMCELMLFLRLNKM